MKLFPAEFSPRAVKEIQKLDFITKKIIGKKIDFLEDTHGFQAAVGIFLRMGTAAPRE